MLPSFGYIQDLTPYEFNPGVADSLTKYLNRLDKICSRISNSASDKRDFFYNMNDLKLKKLEDDYYNYKLLEIVTKPYERKKFWFIITLLYKIRIRSILIHTSGDS